MKRLVIVASGLVLALAAAEGRAADNRPDHPLDGYICMAINLTAQQTMDPTIQVAARLEPFEASPTLGPVGLQVAVKDPRHEVKGFTEILYPTGKTAWIASDLLVPYHSEADPTARCVPYQMKNGRYGFVYPH